MTNLGITRESGHVLTKDYGIYCSESLPQNTKNPPRPLSMLAYIEIRSRGLGFMEVKGSGLT